MAFTFRSFNNASIFLGKETCVRFVSPSHTSITINFGIRNYSGNRAFSKIKSQSQSISSRNVRFTEIRGKSFHSSFSRVKLITSTANTESIIPFSIKTMHVSASTFDNRSVNTKVSQSSHKDKGESMDKPEKEAPSTDSSASSPPPAATNQELSRGEKLKQAVRDYGATVMVFHVTMSLMSLGFFYLLVESGLDVVSILAKLGISESVLKSKVTEEAGKFVIAYAVHKVFAPLRITITLTATPFIVRKLRTMGILKQMAKPKTS